LKVVAYNIAYELDNHLVPTFLEIEFPEEVDEKWLDFFIGDYLGFNIQNNSLLLDFSYKVLK